MQKVFTFCFLLFCGFTNGVQNPSAPILPGAYKTEHYFPLLENKNIGLTVNHSSLIHQTHLTDTLLNMGFPVIKVFTPEHGFSGTISNGIKVDYEKGDHSFELISLYGKNKKPTDKQLEEIDIMIFDIQDVGARFYTYISTMHYVMEACAENNIPLIILDRPNPNGSYVDGPVLDTAYSSFVGMHPIPIVHGMTVGELAKMMNGEKWLNNGIQCRLSIVKVQGWSHSTTYVLPVNPSPNIPDNLSAALYPSLCLFEGTIMSVGRGTDFPFQQIGHPDYPDTTYSFTIQSEENAKQPPYKKEKYYGLSWIGQQPRYSFTLQPLIEVYQKMNRKNFFNDYFKRLVGNEKLQQQIETGQSEKEIRATWEKDLNNFKEKRINYLIYD